MSVPRSLALALVLLCPVAGAAEAPTARVAKLGAQAPDDPERKEMARVQIVLDRALFRPGKIDGLGGEFTQKAADRYAHVMQLAPGARIDTSIIPEPYRDYTVTEDDLAWVGKTAAKPELQAQLKRLPYANTWEALAEKFHADLNFIQELNPGFTAPPQPGEVVRVPDVEPFEMLAVVALEKQRNDEARARKKAQEAAAAAGLPSPTPTPTPEATPAEPKRRLVLLREPRLIELYEDDQLVGCFPCTPGSSKFPVPEGTHKITSNTLMPYFRWDKSVLETGKRSETFYNLPPGPNNPVGIVWLALNIPSRGMHGTASPDQIGRNESSGCVRMANWDAWILAQRIKRGTPVEVR